jgi:hypothetical protein
MNESQRRECERLRASSSEKAADYILAKYGTDSPGYGEVFVLLPHRSWKRADQVRLARHYFQKIPFASTKPYEAFASFMSLPLLIELLEEFAPEAGDKLDLFSYHIEPVLKRKASNVQELSLVEGLLGAVAAKGLQAHGGDVQNARA